jgi:hypothetical protein
MSHRVKNVTLFTFSFCIYLHLSQFSLISKDIKYYSGATTTTQLSVIGELAVWNSPTKQFFDIPVRHLTKLPLAKTGIGDKILLLSNIQIRVESSANWLLESVYHVNQKKTFESRSKFGSETVGSFS